MDSFGCCSDTKFPPPDPSLVAEAMASKTGKATRITRNGDLETFTFFDISKHVPTKK